METPRITVRLDEVMLSELEAMKRKMGLRGVSELVREAVADLLKSDQPQLTREMAEEFKVWRQELKRIGVNLNQVAYRMNADHPLSSAQLSETLGELNACLKEVATNTKRIRNGLGV